jgi:hypothetical protein
MLLCAPVKKVARSSHTRVYPMYVSCALRMCVPSGHPLFLWHHTRYFHLRDLLSDENANSRAALHKEVDRVKVPWLVVQYM